ncbi:hypothetical protein BKA70DRAFT_883096 [Coprinopsis sp. MPI-PUGE-AT-0042]|nr:hypothetical protein BKA70DRAFT_883096 [Coprinopsis sp. MPI-PUGE-AT-0042]
MPSLRRATLVLSGTHIFLWFLEKHGRQVNELQIHRVRWGSINLGGLCPNLEHLVLQLDSRPHLEGTLAVLHPTLQWLDVWEAYIRKSSMGVTKHESTVKNIKKTCPALQGIRLLDSALVHLPRLPFLLPPSSVLSPHDAYGIEFFGFHLRHESWYIVSFGQPIRKPSVIRGRDSLWEDGESDQEEFDSGWSYDTSVPPVEDPTDLDWTPSSDPEADTSSEFSEGELEDLFTGANSEDGGESSDFFSAYDSE